MPTKSPRNLRLEKVSAEATIRARALQKNLKAQGFDVVLHTGAVMCYIRMKVSRDGYSVPVEINVSTYSGYHSHTLDEPKFQVGPVGFEGARRYYNDHRLTQRCYTKTDDPERMAGRVAAYHAEAGVPYHEARVAREKRDAREAACAALQDRATAMGLHGLTITGPSSGRYSITGLGPDDVEGILEFIAGGAPSAAVTEKS